MSRRRLRSIAPVALALSLAAPWSSAQLQFTDVSFEAGVAVQHTDVQFMMGSGCAFVDVDTDDRLDIVLTGGLGGPFLLHNDGGTFTDVTSTSGLQPLPFLSFGMGLACADVDNDGDPDLYFANSSYDRLYRNDGGTFTDVSEAAGIYTAPIAWGASAAFGDYDNDGFVDLYVGNYIKSLQYPNHVPWENTLFHNDGDGTFTNVTGLTGTGGAGTTLAVGFTDHDLDGDQDLWVGNDFGAFVQPNQLYRNDGPIPGLPLGWQFTDIAPSSGADAAIYCMGVTGGDIDLDLDLDYYFSNLGRNVLLRNDGASGFADITAAAGVEGTHDPIEPEKLATSWGVGFHDFDGDSWVDLYVSNGYIPAAPEIDNGLTTPSFIYRNAGDGAGTFTDVTFLSGAADQQIGRGCAFGDYDNDGDIDVLQANVNGTTKLFRNDAAPHHWLRVLPRGRVSNRDGIGARFLAHTESFSLIREASPSYSFESSNDRAVHFGTADQDEIDHLHVHWPSGIEQHLYHVETDQSVELLEPVLTCDPGVTLVPRVGPGEWLHMPLKITNHRSIPQTAIHRLQLRIGDFVWSDIYQTTDLPAGATVNAGKGMQIPASGNGTPIVIEVLWTVHDSKGGTDQWSGEILITG